MTKMKHLLALLITVYFSAFAQETNLEWENYSESYNKEANAGLNFINTERIDDLLIKKKRSNSNKVKVFRIQLYSGNRIGSSETKNRFKKLYPNILVENSYEQPYFKTKVDAIRSRIEAEKILKIYKKILKMRLFLKKKLR